ncbi:MAG TPA: hypothetical protein VIF57_21310 [Polyangia bacterium]|jgi:hypothetical protein
MSCLAPCPACGRHIAVDETACPFCAAALPDSFRHACSSRKPPSARLSRTARLVVGAALIGVQASCAGSAYGTMGGNDAAAVDTGAQAQLEQAPAQTDENAAAPKPEKR